MTRGKGIPRFRSALSTDDRPVVHRDGLTSLFPDPTLTLIRTSHPFTTISLVGVTPRSFPYLQIRLLKTQQGFTTVTWTPFFDLGPVTPPVETEIPDF